MNLNALRERSRFRKYEADYIAARGGVCFIQGDQSIANQAGAAFRSDLNNELQALVTFSQGATVPGTTYRNMTWHDTTLNLKRRRNAANTGWINEDTLDESFVLSRSSNTILGQSDVGKTVVATAAFTQTLTAAATLADGWFCFYNAGGFAVVLDPNASELIDGATTKTVTGSGVILCNGSAFTTIGFSAKQPTSQIFTSGSGTYTTPAGCVRIKVTCVGGGGGGGGGGGTTGAGTAGGNTTFSTLTANGGGAGVNNSATQVSGGTASGGDINIAGGNAGGASGTVSIYSPGGGISVFGCAGGSTAAGTGGAASANSGSGGAGGPSTVANTGGAGAAGGYAMKVIAAPAATYSYAVGAAGSGGAGSQTTGGAGAAGIIIVEEFYV